MSRIEIENRGTTCLLFLDCPPANSLSAEMVKEFEGVIPQLVAQATEIRCLIVASRLESIFIAGADIKMIKHGMDAPNMTGELLTFNRRLQNVINEIEALPFPVVAAINGHALGGGLELALACDFRFMATGRARLGLPEVTLGLLPGAGGTQRLSRLIGKARAKEIIYTSRSLYGDEALALGLVDRVFPSESLLEECLRFGDAFAKRPAVAIAEIKACINQGIDGRLLDGLNREMVALSRLLATEDAKEGVSAFVEKREPRFLGC